MNPPVGDIGVPRHSTCDDNSFFTSLCPYRHRSGLLGAPLASVECAFLGHCVNEGEDCCPALSINQMTIGCQMATVQTTHLVTVIKDSLAL